MSITSLINRMKNRYKIYMYFVLLVVLITACECVPEIVTPKKVTSLTNAKVMILNSHPDISSFELSVDDIVALDNINYNGISSDYKKIQSDNTYFRLKRKDTGVNIYNSVISLVENKFYTCLIYGKANRVDVLIQSDSITNYDKKYTYIRVFCLSPDLKDATLSFVNMESYELFYEIKYRTLTNYMQFYPIKYKIKLFDNIRSNYVYQDIEMEFKPNMVYTILIRGYVEEKITNPIELIILETRYQY